MKLRMLFRCMFAVFIVATLVWLICWFVELLASSFAAVKLRQTNNNHIESNSPTTRFTILIIDWNPQHASCHNHNNHKCIYKRHSQSIKYGIVWSVVAMSTERQFSKTTRFKSTSSSLMFGPLLLLLPLFIFLFVQSSKPSKFSGAELRRLRVIFDQIDLNGDGIIQPEELATALENAGYCYSKVDDWGNWILGDACYD